VPKQPFFVWVEIAWHTLCFFRKSLQPVTALETTVSTTKKVGKQAPATTFKTSSKAEETYKEKGGENDRKLFRPPYGKLLPSQIRALKKKGYRIIFWDVLSLDFDTKVPKETCWKILEKHSQKGSILVFHDSAKAEEKLKYLLPKVLAHFSKKGYRFLRLD